MRIKCRDVDQFVENLKGNKIWNNIIYYDRSSVEETEVVSKVYYQLSCVIELDGGQALLECGIDCRNDINSSDGHSDGTERQKQLHQRMIDFVEDDSTLKFLPGILDM